MKAVRRREGLRALPLIGLLALGGCLTPLDMLRPVGKNPDSRSVRSADSEMARNLAQARRLVESADYSQAVHRLQNIISNDAEGAAGIEARYFLGLTYYQLEAFKDAHRCFSEYLALAPKGEYAKQGQEYLSGLADLRTQNESTITQLQERLETEELKPDADPEKLADLTKLAEVYWRNGQYEDAGALYKRVLAVRPGLAQDEKLRERIETTPDGSLVLLTPEELDRRFAASNPAVLIGVEAFTSRRFRGWYHGLTKDDFYHVTGKVLNRGAETLQSVEVIVTIYTFGSKLLDTKTVSIGRLRPGESRPFSARFTELDTISNVGRYECVVSYGP